MLIVPKASVTDFLLGDSYELDDFRNLLQRLQNCFKMRNNDPQTRELIVQTCQNHLSLVYQDNRRKDLFLGPIAIAATFIADQGLFTNAVRLVTNGFDKNIFFVLGELICVKAPLVREDE